MYFCWCALRHRNGPQYNMYTTVKSGVCCWRCKNEAFRPSHLSALVRTPLSADTLAHAVPHLRRMAKYTTEFLLHLTHRSYSETKTDPHWDGNRKQREKEREREREKDLRAVLMCLFCGRHLEGRRRAPRLYLSKLSFSLSLCLPLVCCKAPISPSHPSVTQHPADQTPSSHSSPPSPLSPLPSDRLSRAAAHKQLPKMPPWGTIPVFLKSKKRPPGEGLTERVVNNWQERK